MGAVARVDNFRTREVFGSESSGRIKRTRPSGQGARSVSSTGYPEGFGMPTAIKQSSESVKPPWPNAGETADPPIYVPYNIKRSRRTKAEIAGIRDAIVDILSEDNPQTVRQVFYALTVKGVIAKAEMEYHRTVIRLLVEMRETNKIPFTWIADNTRWQRKPATFTGLEACLSSTSKFYRRDLWAAMPVYVEVWCEKDALAGVLMQETEIYDVPLMVSRGYSSLSFLHSAAEAIAANGKPAYIYHFGDLDPSGVDAPTGSLRAQRQQCHGRFTRRQPCRSWRSHQ